MNLLPSIECKNNPYPTWFSYMQGQTEFMFIRVESWSTNLGWREGPRYSTYLYMTRTDWRRWLDLCMLFSQELEQEIEVLLLLNAQPRGRTRGDTCMWVFGGKLRTCGW
jgi:hypothetical protein